MNYEITGIIDSLLRLNDTGLYTAMFFCGSNVKYLDIWIYKGKWRDDQNPLYHLTLDYESNPPREYLTRKTVTAQSFEEYLILLVQ